MADIKKFQESELGKLSIEELKAVVKQIKENQADSEIEELFSYSRNKSRSRRHKDTLHFDNESIASEDDKKRLKKKREKSLAKDSKFNKEKDKILKSKIKDRKSGSIEQRISYLEHELEVAKDLDSSFANISNEEKRRKLSQLRRSLLREKYKIDIKQKREFDESLQQPLNSKNTWKESLRRSSQSKSPIPSKRKSKLDISSTAATITQFNKNSSKKAKDDFLYSPKKKITKITATRSSSAISKKLPSKTINARIAARLEDVEEQIKLLEQRIIKRSSTPTTIKKKEDNKQEKQILSLAERLFDLEDQHVKTTEVVASMKEDIEAIQFGQDDQKILLERLTKAVLKHRHQQQDYNVTFENRIKKIEERAGAMERRQRRLRHAIESNSPLQKSEKVLNNDKENNITKEPLKTNECISNQNIVSSLKEQKIDTSKDDEKLKQEKQSTEQQIELIKTKNDFNSEQFSKQSKVTYQQRYSDSSSSDEEIFESEIRKPLTSEDENPELISKYAKLKSAFHRVYGANRNFQKALIKDTESDDESTTKVSSD